MTRLISRDIFTTDTISYCKFLPDTCTGAIQKVFAIFIVILYFIALFKFELYLRLEAQVCDIDHLDTSEKIHVRHNLSYNMYNSLCRTASKTRTIVGPPSD